jgi:hypothetical protein
VREILAARSSGLPKWVVSERLAEDVRKTIALLRTHILYGDQRLPLTLAPEDPDLEAEGTREQQQQEQLAEQGIHRGLPIIGLPVSQLALALSAIESTTSLVDKRIMSIKVQKDDSILVSTGEQVGPEAGGGNILVLKRINGHWVITHESRWLS